MSKQKLPETITWKAPTHNQTPRSAAWYLIFALASLGLVAFGIYSHSTLTVILFGILIVSVLLFTGQPARTITCKLTKTGITSGNTVYPYKIIKQFWIIYKPPQTKTLNFETSAYLNNQISLELAGQDPVAVKLYLGQFLPEDLDREESLSDVLAKTLKI